ncbi:hypothetical protein SEEB0235_13170 [Salmonella enterica subsp. enterica serovar Bareilly str. CFSAN000235]|nr:hypothetical protein SEEB0235_13170 [Salmonella enterica subsp. enterica serovar Bareilly str. CFSAN000235]
MLTLAPYFPELALELLERAKALMFISLSQIDNALCFRFPTDNPDWDATVIFEPSVKVSHESFALR